MQTFPPPTAAIELSSDDDVAGPSTANAKTESPDPLVKAEEKQSPLDIARAVAASGEGEMLSMHNYPADASLFIEEVLSSLRGHASAVALPSRCFATVPV